MPGKYVVDPSLIATLTTTYKMVNSSIHPATACAGCVAPHCCTYSVPVMDIEALIIIQTYPEEVQRRWDRIVERILDPLAGPIQCIFRYSTADALNGGYCAVHACAPRNCRLYWTSVLEEPGDCHPDIARKQNQVYGRIVIPTVYYGTEHKLREESDRLGLPTTRDIKYLELALARMMVLLDPKLAEVFRPTEQVVMDSYGTVEPVYRGDSERVLDILGMVGGGKHKMSNGKTLAELLARDEVECTEDCGDVCDPAVCDAAAPEEVE